ncbi:MAG: hypothetical protein ACQERS_06695 [Bacteroidota bacterium]
MMLGGVLGPVGVILLVVVFLVLFISALILILKNEKGWQQIVWIIIILILPIVGAGIYLLKHAIER